MKASTILVGLLIGIAAVACSESDVAGTCLDSAYCQEVFCPADCPDGVESAICGDDDRCACTCSSNGNPETCADCVGASLGPNNTNPAASCMSAGEPNTCTCLDGMGESYTVYISPAGCF